MHDPTLMWRSALRLRVLLALLLATLSWTPAALAQSPGPASRAATVSDPAAPTRITIGAYVNDIQAIDLRSHSYVIDLYVWFRWTKTDLDPGKTFEFMNMFNPNDHTRTRIYDEPVAQPDGSKYLLYRHQGAFSTKFPVGRYPFDSQVLQVAIEDADMGSDELRYVVDSLTINPAISLPGYVVGEPKLEVRDTPYATAFGDLAESDVSAYSRAMITIPIARPWLSGAVKTLLPVFLIIMCAAAALLLEPQHVEARIGLSITALLTLVALQFAASGILPEVGYLLMLDQIYIASYAFILIVIGIIVASTDNQALAGDHGAATASTARRRMSAAAAVTLYAGAVALIIGLNMIGN
ncbi:MAG: hypothetical protein NW217_13170 [Hyphomicrobiaceae bacterium]|nr:hypothetical protein [Hyphomicrobiaceae bacterium]